MKGPNSDEDSTPENTILGAEEILDVEQLRLPQNFGEMLQGQKVVTTIPVRKPDSQMWIRVHPDPSFGMDTALLIDQEDKTAYLVEPVLWNHLLQDLRFMHLYVGITRQENLFIWPVRLPRQDGKLDNWNSSAHQIAGQAKGYWLRVMSNMQVGAYEYVVISSGQHPEPEWPSHTFAEILNLAFKGRIIRDLIHPVVKKLRGEL